LHRTCTMKSALKEKAHFFERLAHIFILHNQNKQQWHPTNKASRRLHSLCPTLT
jgi:hypothetical protein